MGIKALDILLLRLGKSYEQVCYACVFVAPAATGDIDPIHRYVESLIAVGWLMGCGDSRFRLTPSGYRKLKFKIEALRATCRRQLRDARLNKDQRQSLLRAFIDGEFPMSRSEPSPDA